MEQAGVNRTQSQIVFAGVAIAAISAVVVFKNFYGEFSKHDVLGVVPGMTRSQVDNLIKSRKWVCQPASDSWLDCGADAGRLQIGFAESGENAAVTGVRVRLRNRENLTVGDIAGSISRQYGRPPVTATGNDYRWQLDNGQMLQLEAVPALVLSLNNQALIAQEQAARTKAIK